jgi:DNA-binding CsgD family transcriptional regulator
MDSESSHPPLTPREHQLLHLVAGGANSVRIAAELGLSTRMVRTETQSILEKLGVHSRLEAVVRYFQSDPDAGLRDELWRLSPRSREALLRWLLADEGDRDDIASQALKRREGGDALAKHIETLTTQPEQHQRFLRLLREIDPESG